MIEKMASYVNLKVNLSIFKKIIAKLLRVYKNLLEERIAHIRGSYSHGKTSNKKLLPILDSYFLKSLTTDHCIPRQVVNHYVNHRFDLLGSGWVQIRYGMKCRGTENYHYRSSQFLSSDKKGLWLKNRLNNSNLRVARSIWNRINTDYEPIDWQLDFKSGFRWSEKKWARSIKVNKNYGIDIKVPWELSRMQHLPQIALYAVASNCNNRERKYLVEEIKNQWLDFISNNPPGFGVNWACPMDIAIRSANWCLTWDILRAKEIDLEIKDENILANSLYDHGCYIVKHLEWYEERANHYLANICGLIFIASYLNESKETNQWLAFAINQLQTETKRQFLIDGGNFEGSTAYHRLSFEMVLYSTVLISGLPLSRLLCLAKIDPKNYAYLPINATQPQGLTLHEIAFDEQKQKILTPFDESFINRIQKALNFVICISKHDGTFPQIGDNDSGRFLKLNPIYKILSVDEAKKKFINIAEYTELPENDIYFMEEHCNATHILNAASGLIANETNNNSIDFRIIKAFRPKLNIKMGDKRKNIPQDELSINLDLFLKKILDTPNTNSRKYLINQIFDKKIKDLEYYYFRNFGLHIWKSKCIYLSVRSIETNNIKTSGHFHDDQLSFELTINGIPVIRDPGTYIYTPLLDKRNYYRSREAHFITIKNSELKIKPFEKISLLPVNCIYAGKHGFAGELLREKSRDQLVIKINEEYMQIIMQSESINEIVSTDTPEYSKPYYYSPGYGILERY